MVPYVPLARDYKAGVPPDQHSCPWRAAAALRHYGITKLGLPRDWRFCPWRAAAALRHYGITKLGFPRDWRFCPWRAAAALRHYGITALRSGVLEELAFLAMVNGIPVFRDSGKARYSGIPVRLGIPVFRYSGKARYSGIQVRPGFRYSGIPGFRDSVSICHLQEYWSSQRPLRNSVIP